MNYKILAINPGSTSTKLAIYENENELYKTNIIHSNEELEKYPNIADQYEMRYESIMDFLKEASIDTHELAAVVGRGGLLPPVKSGAYLVNEKMVNRLKNNPVVHHASNLGAMIAFAIAKAVGVNSYIYDSIAVDELEDIARITGLKEVKRKSLVHTLNMRAIAIKTAKESNKDYNSTTAIVAHLGGGITISLHKNGKMIDIVSDDEGPFSPERSGGLPGKDLVSMCYKNDIGTMKKKLRGKGGLTSLLNTNNTLEVQKMIDGGDENARLIYEAMAYQVAKGIGELATVADGKIDHIILTGGIAYSEIFTSWIKKRVEFIAPVIIVAGENELESLAQGALRVLTGEEKANIYDID
ncbi:MAG: butyrate kinase [Bacillota bacterium]|nr:butyrate kinase [Bacillota bacterium]